MNHDQSRAALVRSFERKSLEFNRPLPPSPGRVAYEAFMRHSLQLIPPLPIEWEDLVPAARIAWEKTANDILTDWNH